MTSLVLFHTRCGGLGAYTRFRGQTRVPTTNLVLPMRFAVVLLPAGRLPPHGGPPCGCPARGSGRGLGGARGTPVPRAKKVGGVAKALNRQFRDQADQGISGGVSLIRGAINLWYTFSLAYKLNYKIVVLVVTLLVQHPKEGYLCFRGVRSHTAANFM